MKCQKSEGKKKIDKNMAFSQGSFSLLLVHPLSFNPLFSFFFQDNAWTCQAYMGYGLYYISKFAVNTSTCFFFIIAYGQKILKFNNNNNNNN